MSEADYKKFNTQIQAKQAKTAARLKADPELAALFAKLRNA